MPTTVDATLKARIRDLVDSPNGITAAELAGRLPRRPGSHRLTPSALEAWLVRSGLATLNAGVLWPTAEAIEAADGLLA